MTDDTPLATPLRAATWNLNHWRQPLLPLDTRRGAWDQLAGPMGVQVALVQEAVPPADLPRDRHVFGELAGHRPWGSGVVALDPAVTVEPIRAARMPGSRRHHRLDAAHPGATAIARVTVAGLQPITVVSVYGVMEGSALISMHRIVADLLPLFDSPDGARVILGGDLNVTQSSSDERYLALAQAVLDAIASLGLVEVKTVVAEPPPGHAECACGCAPHCGHLGTWGRSELDHLYVSPALAPQVAALRVDRSGVEAGLSDHAALVLDLALTAEPTPHAWDEEAFAVEVGRRHGPAARGVVEALVTWAEHKERELASAAGVTAKVLTRFPVSGGVTAEPELLLTLDVQTEPRASQVLCSVHADGRVVVWFGTWKLPPFDERSERERLRKLLNELDGVHVHWRQAGGWPRIPIAALEDRANLIRLTAVLDRLAEESHTVMTPRADGHGVDEGPAGTIEVNPTAVARATGVTS
jgi:endonuclease/exonuclease/phosphatase family metal-dependent hydrolase